MTEPLVLDNVAIPTFGGMPMTRMLWASDYYPDYIRHGGKKTYQEYIQLCERYLDPTKKLLQEFIDKYTVNFLISCKWSNEHWAVVALTETQNGSLA